MRRITFICILLAGTLALLSGGAQSGGEAQDDADSQRVLFRHVVDDTRELRVVRGRDRAAEALQGLVDARLLDQATAVCPVRIELHHGEGGPLVLASRLRVEGKPPAVGIVVLDVAFRAGQVVVAMVEGPDLALWTVPIGTGTPSWTVLPAWEWSVSDALEPLDPRHVEVKLVQRDGGRIRADVKDARRNDTVAYEQADMGAWVLVDRDEGAK